MSVSPLPSAPQTPSRASILGAINPNELMTRGRSDKSRNVDKEHDWQSASHARRCLNCNAMGACPCRGVSLPPEEKRRRIEAVLANTDFAKSRARREFIKLCDLEAKERMGIERGEEDAMGGLCAVEALGRAESHERALVTAHEASMWAAVLQRWEGVWAMVADHARARQLFVEDEEPCARERLAAAQQREHQMHLDSFIQMCHCLIECLAEQASQREDFCSGVLDMIMDMQEEEESVFENMMGMAWQMGLEEVYAITDAKAAARVAMGCAAEDALLAVAAEREAELFALHSQYVAEHGQRALWVEEKAAAREAMAAEASSVLAVAIPAEREAFIAALHVQYGEEHAQRLEWVRAKAAGREAYAAAALAELRAIGAARDAELQQMVAAFNAEHADRLEWMHAKSRALMALDRSATDALLAVQSQRADELHAHHEAFLAEHTQRLAWVAAKHQERCAFAQSAERALWDMFTASRDEAIRMAHASEEGVADVLVLIRAKADERRALMAACEASIAACVTLPEEAARSALVAHCAEEHTARIEWMGVRAADRMVVEESEGVARRALATSHADGLAAVRHHADDAVALIMERRAALVAAMGAVECGEAAARECVAEEAGRALEALWPSYILSREGAVSATHVRLQSLLVVSEAQHRLAIVAAEGETFAAHERALAHQLAALSAIARQHLLDRLQEVCAREEAYRDLIAREGLRGAEVARREHAGLFEAMREAQRRADADRAFGMQQRHMKTVMLRESLSLYAGSGLGAGEDDVVAGGVSATHGLPAGIAHALQGASMAQMDQLSALVFAFGDHVGSFVGNVDKALQRGAQLMAEEERTTRQGATMAEQHEYYTNKHFTDGATQQAKLASMRQTVANRKVEARRLEGTLREAEQEVRAHKARVEGMKDSYRGKR